jgi:hypothetical protein
MKVRTVAPLKNGDEAIPKGAILEVLVLNPSGVRAVDENGSIHVINPGDFVPVILGETGRNMHSDEIMKTLELKAGGHLPKEGMPIRKIQDIQVYVRPSYDYKKNNPLIKVRKSSTHRVIAICPSCGRHLSAGRLHQHICKQP